MKIGMITDSLGALSFDELLDAAKNNDHAAIDMVAIWGNGYRAALGGIELRACIRKLRRLRLGHDL